MSEEDEADTVPTDKQPNPAANNENTAENPTDSPEQQIVTNAENEHVADDVQNIDDEEEEGDEEYDEDEEDEEDENDEEIEEAPCENYEVDEPIELDPELEQRIDLMLLRIRSQSRIIKLINQNIARKDAKCPRTLCENREIRVLRKCVQDEERRLQCFKSYVARLYAMRYKKPKRRFCPADYEDEEDISNQNCCC